MIIDLLLRNGVDHMKYLFNKKLLQNNDEDIPKLSRKDIKLITHGVAIINNSNDVDLENESEKISAVYEILPGKRCHYMLMTPREMINLFNNK